MFLTDLPPLFYRVLAVIFGLLWGSFLNVVIYRVPRDMSVVSPPSHCPNCEEPIKGYRNIPVLSWVFMRGKASCCGAAVPARYVLVELLGGALSWAILEALVLPLGPHTTLGHAAAVYLSYLALALGLVAAAFIDIEHMIVPDSVSLGGTILGLATFWLRDMSIVEALAGGAIGFLVVWLPFDVLYRRFRGKVGMGMGDAKLVMLAGAWFGWGGALLVLGAGAVQGTLIIMASLLLGGDLEEPEAVKREREEILAELEQLSPEERAEVEEELALDPLAEAPASGLGQARLAFGPFLILATLELMLLGPERIIGWLFSV